jgi:hypothetical protein
MPREIVAQEGIPMRVNRRFLYGGVFLVAIGGVVVAADVGAVDTAALSDAIRLWPLVPIAIGLGIVLRRTQFGLSTGLFAAAVPGLVLGGAVAVAPRFVADCGARGETASLTTQQGTFGGSASVSIMTGCGSLAVNTAPGSGWQLRAGNSAGRSSSITSSPRTLAIGSGGGDGWHFLDGGRDSWDLTLPTSNLDALSLVANANRSQVDLPDAQIGRLAITVNVSDVVINASGASIATLSAVVNVGSLSIHLPANGGLVGSLRLGAGKVQVCTPPGLGLRVTSTGLPRQVTVNGLQQNGTEWQSADYASASHHAALDVRVNFGTIEINPIGGCK